jgi:solute carrier family 12 (sodium/potassium/chloride transporter), member 2
MKPYNGEEGSINLAYVGDIAGEKLSGGDGGSELRRRERRSSSSSDNESYGDAGNAGSGGSYAYVYEQHNQTLRRLTLGDLPMEEHYKGLKTGPHRPTMEELMTGKMEDGGEAEAPAEAALKGKVVKFGWREGVLLRCLLCIWGVMLFLRLSWVVGQAGIIQGLIVITLANSITGITGLSMSAIATNGQISGGGVYYLISRALGPELGGAIGLMFTLANSISVATYTIGFCDNVLDLAYDMSPSFHGIVDEDCKISDCRLNDLRILGSPIIVLILILAIVGMDWVTRVDKFLLFVLLVAQLDMFTGSFVNSGNLYVTEEERYAKGFTGWSLKTAGINLDVNFGSNGMKEESFMSVFGVFFTAVTGITAGANLSGDLKDPSEAIPKGTLIAIVWTYISYMFFAIMVGFNFLPQASGDVAEWRNESNTSLAFDDCSLEAQAVRGYPCEYGAAVNQKTIMYISYTGYLVFFGCYAATLSSAIASFIGAPRVLQAVGKDKIYPVVSFFGKGRGANNDPVRGYFLVFCIAFGCLMIASLNTIGSLASNFFLAAYALINFSVFHSSMTKSPGWRPSFKFYNPWLSLIGTGLAIGTMFAMEWRLALATIAIIAILYMLMLYLKPDATWGSSAEALKFNNALTNVQILNEVGDHVKTYRPKILLLCGNPAHRQPLVDFANLLTKKLSLLVCVQVLNKDEKPPVDTQLLSKNVNSWLKDHQIEAFYVPVKGSSSSSSSNNNILSASAVKSCIELVGLGKLRPNMILMGFRSERRDLAKITEYVEILTAALENKLSVGILRVRNGLDFSSVIGTEETILADEAPDSAETAAPRGRFALPKPKMTANKKRRRVSVFRGNDGHPLPQITVRSIEQFRGPPRSGHIDVWWLYDDGGLTILLPYILQTRKQFRNCKLRIFSATAASNMATLDIESANFANLLKKFRIDYSEVTLIPGLSDAEPRSDIREEFEKILTDSPAGAIEPADLAANAERTNRHLRLAELLREHSLRAELVVATLPLPRRGQASPALYLAWLEVMTRGLPPVLLTRGNQDSVLTFYS